jgi:hypothetical protein
MRDEEMLAEIEEFIEGFNQPTYRGMRINGQGSLRGRPSTGGAGCSGYLTPVDSFRAIPLEGRCACSNF